MRKLFFATKNKFKIQNMRDRLRGINIEVISPYDINIDVEVEEIGQTVIENAILKAKTYYEKVKIPTIAGDSSLFVEKFDKQPGLFVRRIDGRELDNEELEKYYIKELNKVGGKSKAFYITGLAMIVDGEVKTAQIKEDEFILMADVCECDDIKDPLGRIEFDEKINKYFCEMNKEDKKKRNYIFDRECVKFIVDNIK